MTTSAPPGQFAATSSFPGTDIVRQLVRLEQNETPGVPVPLGPLPEQDVTASAVGITPAGSTTIANLEEEAFALRPVPGLLRGPTNSTPQRTPNQAEAAVLVPPQRAGVLAWHAASDRYFAEQAAPEGIPEEMVATLPAGGSSLAALFGLGMTAAGFGGYLSDPEPEAEHTRPHLPAE